MHLKRPAFTLGIEDEYLRIDLMNQMTYFLPHLLALSTSSPFWTSEDMGMMSYRLAVWDSLPRTGLPDRFGSWGEYRRLVAQIVNAGLIEDVELLDCVAEIENAREIVRRGTSAHRQLALYNGAMADGASKEEALASVVDALIEETVSGL